MLLRICKLLYNGENMTIDWYKCKGNVWCELFKLDLSHKYLSGLTGVYIIWSGTGEKSCLRVGYGDIQKELLKHSKDIAMNAFSHLGVYVTWAEVSAFKRKGVVSFLHQSLDPKFVEEEPKSSPVAVDLPW